LVAILNSDSMPTALSQVVPVVESCPYEFSFSGIAWDPGTNEPPAVAEILWLNNCGLLRADAVPIKLLPEQGDATSFSTNMLAPDAAGRAPLLFHRELLMAPAGAEQAEVRFTVPIVGGAAIDQVSLSATSEAAVNADFKLQQEGRLVCWTVSPGIAPGFAVLADGAGIELRNAGATVVELVQKVTVSSGSPFTLEFKGKAVAGSSPETSPQVELRWLKSDQTPTGSPTVLEIPSDGLSSSIASQTAPADATEAEIQVVIPPRTTLQVKNISLRFSSSATVPLTFIAESPGELTLSDVRIAFEQVAPQAPPVSERGLCTATPPGCEPGENGDSCFCHQCEEETDMIEMQPVMTREGRPATMARCSTCRSEVLRAGGPLAAGAETLNLRQTSVPGPIIVSAPSAIESSALSQPEAITPSLTDLRGIAEARAKQLTEAGIDSVEKLAAATPETVAKIKFISPEMASQLIAQAKSRLPGS
jgi:predicted flap endonuclease-1-like 5' DNA nuclease